MRYSKKNHGVGAYSTFFLNHGVGAYYTFFLEQIHSGVARASYVWLEKFGAELIFQI